jgi:hypothetical protein
MCLTSVFICAGFLHNIVLISCTKPEGYCACNLHKALIYCVRFGHKAGSSYTVYLVSRRLFSPCSFTTYPAIISSFKVASVAYRPLGLRQNKSRKCTSHVSGSDRRYARSPLAAHDKPGSCIGALFIWKKSNLCLAFIIIARSGASLSGLPRP